MDLRIDSIDYNKSLNHYKVLVLHYKQDNDSTYAGRYEAFVEPSGDNSYERISEEALNRARDFFIKNDISQGTT